MASDGPADGTHGDQQPTAVPLTPGNVRYEDLPTGRLPSSQSDSPQVPTAGVATSSRIEPHQPAWSDRRHVMRKRDRYLWLWPVLAFVVLALAGQVWGPYGALLAAMLEIATILLLFTEGEAGRHIRLPVATASVAVVATVVVIHPSELDRRPEGVTAAPPRSADAGAQSPRTDLRGHEVTQQELTGKDLRRAALGGANLDGLDLTRRDLLGADLRGASLRGIDLDDANLLGADLRGADLRGASFRRACLYHADLRGANLTGVDADRADVTAVSVSPATVATAAAWPAPTEGTPTACSSAA